MGEVARVVLALEEHDVAEEVMHFLDRIGRTRVVATATDDRQLAEAVRQLEPDAIIAQPSLVGPGTLDGSRLLAVETRESVASLRAAIRAGARGFYVWPAEREGLASAAAASAVAADLGARRAVVLTALAPRGGAGATFVTTHLAAAFARRGRSCVLVDADPAHADLTAALGAYRDDDEAAPRTIAELVPLIDELDRSALDEVLWPHPDGFRALLGPEPAKVRSIEPDAIRRAIEVAARSVDVVVVHASRALDPLTAASLDVADRTLIVLALDVLSFRAATRALELLPVGDLDFVVNRASRAEVTPGDVERVFGRPPIAVFPLDRAVPRAQDHGRLVPARGRTARAFDRLADRLVAPVAGPSGES